MHIHIEQHIMALVVTNAVEAERVDIGRILHWLLQNVKSPAVELAIIHSSETDTLETVWFFFRG